MTAIGTLEVKSSTQNWIKKLATRKKKRFRLQMQAAFGCRDHRGGKSQRLVVSRSTSRMIWTNTIAESGR